MHMRTYVNVDIVIGLHIVNIFITLTQIRFPHWLANDKFRA